MGILAGLEELFDPGQQVIEVGLASYKLHSELANELCAVSR
jgi:hypothetical protein